MGELVEVRPMEAWIQRIDENRDRLVAAAKSGNRVAAAFAMADARVDLIQSLADENIRARLLVMTDPDIAMVELANNPTDDDRIRVCAIAILSGFCPGEDQFAIFGAGRNKDGSPKAGKLYTKEAGFRKLFGLLGIVPEVRTSHPEFVTFGTAGKKIWRVGGSGSCDYNGREFSVHFDGEELIGVPGFESDNVAGVTAKARRRILQALWSKASPILTGDQIDDDETETAPQPVPAALPAAPEPRTVAQIADEFETTRKAIEKRLSKDPSHVAAFMELWNAIRAAKTQKDLKAVGDEIKTAAGLHSERDLAELRRWYVFCDEQLKPGKE